MGTTFPVSNGVAQIPVQDLEAAIQPYLKVLQKDNTIELEEDFDIDFRELQEDEITPEIQAAYEEAINAPKDRFVNL